MKKALAIVLILSATVIGIGAVLYYSVPNPIAYMAIFFMSITGSLTTLYVYYEHTDSKKVTRWEE